jgi:hypothetical protein
LQFVHAEVIRKSALKSEFGDLTADDVKLLEPGAWANDRIVLWAAK